MTIDNDQKRFDGKWGYEIRAAENNTDRDEQQAPDRIYLSRFWRYFTEHSCQFSYERKAKDDIEYRASIAAVAGDAHCLFKNVCRLHTSWTIDRYLMSNAVNRLDPAEKAERHIDLCRFYVAAIRGCSLDDVMSDYGDDFDSLHEESQELTSSMDTEIGFPLDRTPNYDELNPKFFERFHAIACRVLGVSSAAASSLLPAEPAEPPTTTSPSETAVGGEILCLICDSSQRHLHAYADHPFVSSLDLEIAKQEFLNASIAVWREIDRLSALPEGYKGLPSETDPRKRELAAWEKYKAMLDAAALRSGKGEGK